MPSRLKRSIIICYKLCGHQSLVIISVAFSAQSPQSPLSSSSLVGKPREQGSSRVLYFWNNWTSIVYKTITLFYFHSWCLQNKMLFGQCWNLLPHSECLRKVTILDISLSPGKSKTLLSSILSFGATNQLGHCANTLPFKAPFSTIIITIYFGVQQDEIASFV